MRLKYVPGIVLMIGGVCAGAHYQYALAGILVLFVGFLYLGYVKGKA